MTTHNQSTLILQMRDHIREIEEHEHPRGEDFFCFNLVGWMGERMKYVLRILDEAQAEIDELHKRESALADDAMKLIGEARREVAIEIGGRIDQALRGMPGGKSVDALCFELGGIVADFLTPDGRIVPAEKSTR